VSVTASKVQEKNATVGAGTTTFAATFDTAATAGNLIVWVSAVDGNSGTTTQPSDTPNLPIELKSNDVSLILAWGVADGGETTISGTVGSNVAGGRVWIIELQDSAGTGSWARRGTTTIFTSSGGATSADATITSTPTITEGGYGIAAATWDAVATAGTASWSNSWVKDFDGASGTAVSMWTATKASIAAGGTESTTLTRSGGTAEQYQALLVVFGKVAPTTVNAAVAGSAPHPTGTLAATQTDFGAVAGSAPHPTGTLAATQTDFGAMVGQTPHPIGVLIGTLAWAGSVAGRAPQAIGTLTAAVRNLAVLAGSAPAAVGNMFGGTDFGVLAGSAPAAVGKLRTLRRPFTAASGPGSASLDGGLVAAGQGGAPIAVLDTGPAATTAVLTP
jgi:hypothetical protein